jgi:hypothetical protein
MPDAVCRKKMFSEAYKLASKYTFPVLISSKLMDGTLESGVGAFVIINEDGWFITAAHMLNGMMAHQQHVAQYQEYLNQKTQTTLSPNPKWILQHSLWFGADNHKVNNFHILKDNDLAVGKIENFNSGLIKNYPRFIRPENVIPGTSLCKLGFPFYDVAVNFNESMRSFVYDQSIFPIPMFPMEGIMTRNVLSGNSPDGKFEYKWLETSSPGLRGQSGGPTFDRYGNIWALQSQTRHLPLGFSPKVNKNGIEIEENQFLNVGWGVHADTITKFLDFHGVKYYSA